MQCVLDVYDSGWTGLTIQITCDSSLDTLERWYLLYVTKSGIWVQDGVFDPEILTVDINGCVMERMW